MSEPKNEDKAFRADVWIAQPVGDRVIIRPEGVAEKTDGGMLLPENTDDRTRPSLGVIVGVGSVDPPRKMTVQIGDRVAFGRFSGHEISINGDVHVIIKESDVLVILDRVK